MGDAADGETQDAGLGLHGFELTAAVLSQVRSINFTSNGETHWIGWAKTSMSPSTVPMTRNAQSGVMMMSRVRGEYTFCGSPP
jgi:hypothetical protein